ncbi:MAG: alpha/beta hydrolase family protein, partial [Candidatus Hodarchaeota archaeon]
MLISSRRAKVLLVGVIILALGVVSTFSFTFNADAEHPYSIRYHTLEPSDGTLLQALVYTPVDTSNDCPGVVVGHGFSLNKQYMQPLSIELVKRGFVVVNIDFRGHGSSEGYLDAGNASSALIMDMLAGVEYLEDLGFVDRIGLVGHSMGGGTAMLTALQNPSKINATVSIGGLSTSSEIIGVSNLLAVFGYYEQIVTRDAGLSFLRQYTGLENVEIDTLYGDFIHGNATKVSISPYSEHYLEVIDSAIIYETVQWFEYAFNGAPAMDVHLTAPFLIISLFTSLTGLLLVLFAFILYLGSYIFKGIQEHPRLLAESEKFPLRPIFGYLLAMLIALILLSPLSVLFADVAPITMFNFVLGGQVVGFTIGVLVASFLLIYKGGKLQLQKMVAGTKELSSTKPFLSLIYGVVTGIVSIGALMAILDWSFVTSSRYKYRCSFVVLFLKPIS